MRKNSTSTGLLQPKAVQHHHHAIRITKHVAGIAWCLNNKNHVICDMITKIEIYQLNWTTGINSSQSTKKKTYKCATDN
jgi:hypothetical protein